MKRIVIITIVILCLTGIILGLVFGLKKNKTPHGSGSGSGSGSGTTPTKDSNQLNNSLSVLTALAGNRLLDIKSMSATLTTTTGEKANYEYDYCQPFSPSAPPTEEPRPGEQPVVGNIYLTHKNDGGSSLVIYILRYRKEYRGKLSIMIDNADGTDRADGILPTDLVNGKGFPMKNSQGDIEYLLITGASGTKLWPFDSTAKTTCSGPPTTN